MAVSELNPVKIGYAVPISREVAVAYGLVEPTEEENAAMRARHFHYAAWRQRRDERHQRVTAALREAGDLERRLMELHSANDRGECQGCDFSGGEGEPPEWPCRTVALLAEHHGLQIEEPI